MILKEPVVCRRPVYRIDNGVLKKEVVVALTGDWHVSRIVSDKQRHFLKKRLELIKPDVIILQGDLFDTPTAFLDSSLVSEMKKSLKVCSSVAPTVMVLGNHDQVEPVHSKPKSHADYLTRVFPGVIDEWRRICEETGVILLLDNWFEVNGLRIFGFLQGPEAYYRKPGKRGENMDSMKKRIKQLSLEGIFRRKPKTVSWFAAHAPIKDLYSMKELSEINAFSFGHTHGGCIPIGIDVLVDALGGHGGLIAPFLKPFPSRYMRGCEKLETGASFIVNTGMVMTQDSAPSLLHYINFLKSAEVTEVRIK
jgi:hypothetical protein